MPRLFAKASTQSLKAARAAVTAPAFTMCAWYNPTTSNAAGSVLALTTSANNTNYFALAVNASGFPFIEGADGTATDAIHATTVTNGTWGHILATSASTSSRIIYFNGVNPVTDSATRAPVGINQTSIGALFGSSAISLADGIIQDAAIWNVVLTQDEITRLAKGISPLRIRPANLVMYCPVTGLSSPEPDETSNVTFTVTGATASTNTAPTSKPSNNYQTISVGNGMSAGEKIR